MKQLANMLDGIDNLVMKKLLSCVRKVSFLSIDLLMFYSIISESCIDETLHPAHQPYVEEPKAVFPLSKADGPLEVIYREFEGVENLVAYYTFWAPTGLIGSPLFDIDLDHESRITVELPGFNIKSFTIFMWIRPTFDEIQTSIMVTYFHFINLIY